MTTDVHYNTPDLIPIALHLVEELKLILQNLLAESTRRSGTVLVITDDYPLVPTLCYRLEHILSHGLKGGGPPVAGLSSSRRKFLQRYCLLELCGEFEQMLTGKRDESATTENQRDQQNGCRPGQDLHSHCIE